MKKVETSSLLGLNKDEIQMAIQYYIEHKLKGHVTSVPVMLDTHSLFAKEQLKKDPNFLIDEDNKDIVFMATVDWAN